MKKTLFLIFLGTSILATSQVQFIRSYGNLGFDYGRDVVEDLNKNLYLTGSSSSFVGGNADAFIMKTDLVGNFEWSYNYGGSESEWGESILFTKDSNLAIAGYTSSFGEGGFDFYLLKADSTDGTPIWEKSYGGSDWDRAFDFVQLPDSGFVLVGETYSFNDGILSGLMVRTDKNGDTLWTKLFSGAEEVFLKSIALDLSGDSIVVAGGSGNGGSGGLDGYIAKMDLDGNIGWEKYDGTVYDDYWNDIYHLDTYYAVGGAKSANDADGEDHWFMKLNYLGGSTIWEQDNSTGSTHSDIVHSMCIRENGPGDVYYAGSTNSYGYSLSDGWDQIFFAKREPDASFLAQGEYGNEGPDIAHCIKDTYDQGAVIICDSKHYALGGSNIVIIKIQASWNMPDIDWDLVYQPITTSVGKEEMQAGLLLYPNPTSGELHIQTDLLLTGIELFNLQGQQLEVFESTDLLNLERLERGTYILQLKTEERSISRIIQLD